MLETQCVIIGAGVAGAATAYQLSRRGLRDIVILEQEEFAGYHSSGRGAAMIRQIVPDRETAALTREGARFLAGVGAEWADPEIFRRRGSLLLSGAATRDQLLGDVETARQAGLDVELWEPSQVESRVEATRGSTFECAAFTPSDGTVDARRLLEGFLGEAQAAGVRVFYSHPVEKIRTDASRRVTSVKAGNLEISTPRVINAAGAWASRIGELAGASPVSLVPHRRHLLRSTAVAKAELERPVDPEWPFVWNLGDEAYFRPDAGGLLVCACDHTRASPCDAQPEPDSRRPLEDKLGRVFPALRGLEIERCWAGHRTFAADERFVVGPDPLVSGFYWVAGLGGHGVTTSAAVGALAAATILDPERDGGNPFSPKRFRN